MQFQFKAFKEKYLILSLKRNKGLREIILFAFVAIFYKVSRFIAIGDIHTAFVNAYRVVAAEKSMGIFQELKVQHLFLNHRTFILFLNKFYMAVHVPSIIAFFIWMYHKHKPQYYFVRNGFLLANFITLFIFVAYPCAPPRMLHNLGFVDTLLQMSKLNLYKSNLTRFFNQYAAMPSMHFGTALIFGICLCIYSKNKLLKIASIIYPFFVLLVIVVTGNHFFLDAIMGALISAIGFALYFAFEKVFKLSISKTHISSPIAVSNTSLTQ